METLIRDLDPEVHGVGSDELRTGALLQRLELIVRAHVGEHGHLSGSAHRLGHLGQPVFQHVDAHLVRGAGVHVVEVFAGPGEAFAAAALDAFQGNSTAGEHLEVILGEVMTDDAHQMHGLAEDAGCKRGVGRRTAE